MRDRHDDPRRGQAGLFRSALPEHPLAEPWGPYTPDSGRRRDLGDRNPSQGFTGGYGGAVAPRHEDDAGGSYAASVWQPVPRDGEAPFTTERFDRHPPHNAHRRDDQIAADVCEALTRDPYVDASEVEVHVEDGDVTLEGVVEDRQAKRHAEELVMVCRGVHDVHNRLRVRRGRFDQIAERLGHVHD